MSIVFALVAYHGEVVSELAAQGTSGNFAQVSRSMIKRLGEESRAVYVVDNYSFHLSRNGDLVYLCLSTPDAGRRLGTQFLKTLENEVVSAEARVKNTPGIPRYSAKLLDPVLEKCIGAHCGVVVEGLSEVRESMKQNIEKLVSRGDRLESLVDRGSKLEGNAMTFRAQGKRMRKDLCLRRFKVWGLLIGGGSTCVYIIAAIHCGLALTSCTY